MSPSVLPLSVYGIWQAVGTDQSDLSLLPTISDQIPELIPIETEPELLFLEFPDDLIFSISVEDYYQFTTSFLGSDIRSA